MSYKSAKPIQMLAYDVVNKKWAPQPRLQVGPDGTLDIEIVEQLPTEGNNPSYVLSYNAAGYCVKIEETIGATTYTTNIVPQDADTTITQTKTVSQWT